MKGVSACYIVSFDITGVDESVATIAGDIKDGPVFNIVNRLVGKDAEELYTKLTGMEVKK